MLKFVLISLVMAIATSGSSGAGLAAVHLAKMVKPSEKGVSMSSFSDNKVKVAPTLYKDYYQKTRVMVHFPVTETLYQPVEFSTTETEVQEFSTSDYFVLQNQTTTQLKGSLQETITPTLSYDTFEWPTETQIYTQAINKTAHINVTQTVEHGVPFL